MALTDKQTEMIKAATRLIAAATVGKSTDPEELERDQAAMLQDVMALGLGMMNELFELKNAIVALAERPGGVRLTPKGKQS